MADHNPPDHIIAARDEFAKLHQPGAPLILYNVWDAASAKIVEAAGAKAIATGSLAVAETHGYGDGEQLPLDLVLANVRRIARIISRPLSVDIERGYADHPEGLRENARQLAEAGACALNVEDILPDAGADNSSGDKDGDDASHGVRNIEAQMQRIAALASGGLFINARTDLFIRHFVRGEDPNRPELLAETIKRAHGYAEAGASCFFAPALSDIGMIEQLCKESPIPVNMILLPGAPPIDQLTSAGVARISYGPGPWRLLKAQLAELAETAYQP